MLRKKSCKKSIKTGVVIGKFYPPHKGHSFLINTALAKVDELTVIVCDHKEQVIPAEIRAGWIKKIHPKTRVVITPDDLGPDDSKAWAKRTIDILGGAPPDFVFTSEDYGYVYAKFMGSKHILVDKERLTIPISATKIRSKPLKFLDFLEPIVRSYFIKRIALVGAESTGTTTLAKDLAKYFNTVWVPEYGRIYSEGKLFLKNGAGWNSAEFEFIARKQIELEDELALHANKLLVCDTDAFATSVWHERYMGRQDSKVEKIWKKRKYEFHIVTGDEIPFVQDGTRDGEHIRHKMHQRILQKLHKHNLPFLVVSGSRKERLKTSVKYLSKVCFSQ